MSTRRKLRKDGSEKPPRRGAKLMDLPAPERAQVRGWFKLEGYARCLDLIASELKITCSSTTLYATLAFWDSQDRRDRTRAMALAQLEVEKQSGMSPQLFMAALDRRIADIYAADDNHGEYSDIRHLIILDESSRLKGELAKLKLKLSERGVAQKDEEIGIAKRKLAVLEAKEAKAKEAIGDTKLSLEERQARIREIFGVQ